MCDLLTVNQAAEILNVSGPTVRRMIQDGDLDALRIRRAVRVKAASIDRYLEMSEAAGAA